VKINVKCSDDFPYATAVIISFYSLFTEINVVVFVVGQYIGACLQHKSSMIIQFRAKALT
jgi:hypothetical protein